MSLKQANQTSFKKGHRSWIEGLTKETDDRVKRLSEARIGIVPWNKGKTQEDYPQLVMSEKCKERISKSLVGKPSWRKGLTKETNESLMRTSKAQLGEKNHMYGKVGPMKGRKHTDSSKQKMSETKIRNGSAKGKNNGNWKGGITPLYKVVRACPTYKLWVTAIFTRDNWQCQNCGKFASGHLHAHHFKRFAELLEEKDIVSLGQALKTDELWDITNGITFCEKCHMKKHRKTERVKDGDT